MTRDRKLISALRLAALPALIAITLLVAWKLGYFELDRRRQLFDTVQWLRVLPWIETAYVAGYAVVVMLGLPAAILTIVAGAIFGVRIGALLAWGGSLAGTVLAHALARTVARKPLRRLFGEHRLFRVLKDHDDVLALLRLRVIPIAPFAVLAYVAGIAGVSLKRLLIATSLAIIPGVIAYAYVGSALLASMVSASDRSRRALWIAGAVTLATVSLSLLPAIGRKPRE